MLYELGTMVIKITTFEDLNTWKEGHKLTLLIYKVTDKFPPKENFALTDQMRRASISITSNIAEGFTRQGIKEKVQFYLMAKGSLTELQSQLYVARDVGYINSIEFEGIIRQTVIVHKLLTGLIKGVKSFPLRHSS